MSDAEVPPGGRAVDLFLGARGPDDATRDHEDLHQTWGRDAVAQAYVLDVFREADLVAVLPRPDGDRRARLAAALDRAHPGHRWADRLRPPG